METSAGERSFVVCWVGGVRYPIPLGETEEKKFQALEALGTLHVIGFSAGGRPARVTRHARFYLLPTPRLPLLRYLLMTMCGAVLAAWLVLRRDVEILVAQSPYEGWPTALAKQAAALFGKRVALIVESHGDFESALFLQRRVATPALHRWLMTRVAHYVFRHASALRAVSDASRRQLERWAPGKPIAQFMAWTDIEAFLSVKRDVPVSESRDILYVGALTPIKGVHCLVEAFSRVARTVPGSRLWIIGQPRDRDYATGLTRQAADAGLDDRTFFLDALPQSELARYMARARVLVLPSLSEGLGRVIVEAMACGTPVIGTRVGGIPELIHEGVTGWLVPPGDADALAECLLTALRSDTVDAMGERARERARALFSTERYVSGYRQVFEIARGPSADHGKRAAECR